MLASRIIEFPAVDEYTIMQREVNELLRKRVENRRQDLCTSLKLGRKLSILRSKYKRGEWGDWVVKNTAYKTTSEARADITLWESWEPVVMMNYNGDVEALVRDLDAETVNASYHAFAQMHKDTPVWAKIAFLETVIGGEKITGSIAKQIRDCANAVEELPDNTRSIGKNFVESECFNVTFIKNISNLMARPDLWK